MHHHPQRPDVHLAGERRGAAARPLNPRAPEAAGAAPVSGVFFRTGPCASEFDPGRLGRFRLRLGSAYLAFVASPFCFANQSPSLPVVRRVIDEGEGKRKGRRGVGVDEIFIHENWPFRAQHKRVFCPP